MEGEQALDQALFPLAEVIPFPEGGRRHVHSINGIKQNLGALSVAQLDTLRAEALQRREDAALEHMIIVDYIETARSHSYPGGDAS